MSRTPTILRATLACAALACALYLGGCVEAPPQRAAPAAPPAQPVPPPNVEVYAYATQGQTPEQQDRDRYECSQWATQQTGFNPSTPGVPRERAQVASNGPPSGVGTAIGAVAGAIFGAALSSPYNQAGGAFAGALIGGSVGNAADAANAQQTHTVYVADRRQIALQNQQAANYRRAMSACLDGRGYSVT